jgi:hypothetical protein
MQFGYFIFFLMTIGLIFVTINLTIMYKECPEEKIVYRYIPRTFEEEQSEPVPPSEIYYDLFNNPSPWVSSFAVPRRKLQNVNKFNISDIKDTT